MDSKMKIMVKNARAAAIFAAIISNAVAQVKPSPPPPPEENVTVLSAFEVSTDRGEGYQAKSTPTGLKTTVPLLDLPLSVQVINREMLDDIFNTRENIAQTLRYGSSGLITSNVRSDSAARIRGTSSAAALVDGSPMLGAIPDSWNVETVDVLKGPAAVSYASRSFGGLIVVNTKRPMQTAAREATFGVGSGGFYSGGIDLTGPIAASKNSRVSYRLVARAQTDEGFTKPHDRNTLVAVYPTVQFNYHQSQLRLSLDYLNTTGTNYAPSFLKLNARGQTIGPWDGAGKYTIFNAPEWEHHNFYITQLRGTFTQKISDTWEVRIYGTGGKLYAKSDEARFNGNPDQVRGTAQMFDLDVRSTTVTYFASGDVNGKYSFFGVDQTSTFGASYTDSVSWSALQSAPLPTISIYKSIPEQFSSYPKPPASAFSDFGPPGKNYSDYK